MALPSQRKQVKSGAGMHQKAPPRTGATDGGCGGISQRRPAPHSPCQHGAVGELAGRQAAGCCRCCQAGARGVGEGCTGRKGCQPSSGAQAQQGMGHGQESHRGCGQRQPPRHASSARVGRGGGSSGRVAAAAGRQQRQQLVKERGVGGGALPGQRAHRGGRRHRPQPRRRWRERRRRCGRELYWRRWRRCRGAML